MIQNKKDLRRYLEMDQYALNRGGALLYTVFDRFNLEISDYFEKA